MTTWPIDKHASHCATVILFVELWQEAFHIATNCLESVELQQHIQSGNWKYASLRPSSGLRQGFMDLGQTFVR